MKVSFKGREHGSGLIEVILAISAGLGLLVGGFAGWQYLDRKTTVSEMVTTGLLIKSRFLQQENAGNPLPEGDITADFVNENLPGLFRHGETGLGHRWALPVTIETPSRGQIQIMFNNLEPDHCKLLLTNTAPLLDMRGAHTYGRVNEALFNLSRAGSGERCPQVAADVGWLFSLAQIEIAPIIPPPLVEVTPPPPGPVTGPGTSDGGTSTPGTGGAGNGTGGTDGQGTVPPASGTDPGDEGSGNGHNPTSNPTGPGEGTDPGTGTGSGSGGDNGAGSGTGDDNEDGQPTNPTPAPDPVTPPATGGTGGGNQGGGETPGGGSAGGGTSGGGSSGGTSGSGTPGSGQTPAVQFDFTAIAKPGGWGSGPGWGPTVTSQWIVSGPAFPIPAGTMITVSGFGNPTMQAANGARVTSGVVPPQGVNFILDTPPCGATVAIYVDSEHGSRGVWQMTRPEWPSTWGAPPAGC